MQRPIKVCATPPFWKNFFPHCYRKSKQALGFTFKVHSLRFVIIPYEICRELEIENGAAEAAQSANIEDLPVAPNNNPEGKTIWMPPYLDDAGQGLLISADTPIYYGDDFQGYIGIDVSLTKLTERLNTVKPTESSFIFLMDPAGKLIAITPEDAQRLANRTLTQQETSPNGLLGLTLKDINPKLADAMNPTLLSQSGTLDIDLAGSTSVRFVRAASRPGLDVIHRCAIRRSHCQITRGFQRHPSGRFCHGAQHLVGYGSFFHPGWYCQSSVEFAIYHRSDFANVEWRAFHHLGKS